MQCCGGDASGISTLLVSIGLLTCCNFQEATHDVLPEVPFLLERWEMSLAGEHRREALRAAMGAADRVLMLGADVETVTVALRRGAQVWCVDRSYQQLEACRQQIDARRNGEKSPVAFHAPARTPQVHWINARVYLPPVPVDLVVVRPVSSPLMRDFDWQMVQRFSQLYGARHQTAPEIFPGQSVLTAEPVLHTFNSCQAPAPHLESAAVCARNTWSRGSRQVLDIVDFRDPPRETVQGAALLRLRVPGPCNAVRFQISHRACGITWHGDSLVMPLTQRINGSRGDRFEVSLSYKPGGDLQAFAASTRVTEAIGVTKQQAA